MRKRANSCFPEINNNQNNDQTTTSLTVLKPEENWENCSLENLTPVTPIRDENATRQEVQSKFKFDDDFTAHHQHRNVPRQLGSRQAIIKANWRMREMVSCSSCDCNSTSTFGSINSRGVVRQHSSLTNCSSDLSNSSLASESDATSPTSEHRSGRTTADLQEDQPLVSPCDCLCHSNTHDQAEGTDCHKTTSRLTNFSEELSLTDAELLQAYMSASSSITLSSSTPCTEEPSQGSSDGSHREHLLDRQSLTNSRANDSVTSEIWCGGNDVGEEGKGNNSLSPSSSASSSSSLRTGGATSSTSNSNA